MEPFRVDVPDRILGDLAARLRAARWPDAYVPAGGERPARLERIRELAARWRDGFSWRAYEERVNEVPQFLVEVDGVRVHVAALRSGRPPLVLVNGWPSSFLEYLPAARLLAERFDVVIASRPGYGFSDPALDRPSADPEVADLFLGVLDRLGYDTFAAHGDDFGGPIVSWMALRAPDRVRAVHVAEWLEPSSAPEDVTPEERAYLDGLAAWVAAERGYGAVAASRPQTIALALDDSPLGLLAWIADKWLTWSGPGGEDLGGVDEDLVLATATLYWATRTIASSMRPYAEPTPWPQRRVEVPAGVTAVLEDRPPPPRSWLERSYADLRSYEVLKRGGHFWAAADPEAFTSRLTAFFDSV